jgi:hypothetical protein
MMECLNDCVQRINRLAELARRLAINAPSAPVESARQSRQLVTRVRDVAEAFLQTVKAAGMVVGRARLADPTRLSVLMKRATALASVLSALMRTLRVFN